MHSKLVFSPNLSSFCISTLYPSSIIDHVEILLENVVEGQDFNFKKMDPNEVNSLGEPYDYSSIMHYAKGTFASPNKDETIRPKACCPRPPIGQRIQLSTGDIRQTNKLYNCPRKYSSRGEKLLSS
ncbi:unnamed protein product [Protopolystoma xenopodis]|uniref:Metalloendopeptidase n=1 Tax=Protopolystoma xenopodis TaxID=117903 RepID=A0A3S5CQ07_9PLAT|nr:unnamed protein product [Protopolystoma xenopodis]